MTSKIFKLLVSSVKETKNHRIIIISQLLHRHDEYQTHKRCWAYASCVISRYQCI